MARQFDKFIKVLGNNSKADRAIGTWKKGNKSGGTPGAEVSISMPPVVKTDADKKDIQSTGVTSRSYGDSLVIAKQQKADKPRIAAVVAASEERGNALESAQNEKEGLATTTMRQYADGSVHDYEDMQTTSMRPTPGGNVTDLSERPGMYGNAGKKGPSARPVRKANPKFLAADAQRANEDLAKTVDEDRRRTGVIREDLTGEDAFNASEASSGSAIRSINGVTYDMNEWKSGTGFVKNDSRPERPAASELQGATWAGSQPEAKALSEGKEYNPTTTISDYKPTKSKGDIAAEKADENLVLGARLAEKGNIDSTPRKIKLPKKKEQTGTVIPQVAIDTFGNLDEDRRQAEIENRRIRKNRSIPTQTTTHNPNEIPGRPARGKTPERQVVLAGMREERSADLASQGKEMTTVAPEVMATARSLGGTEMYNLPEDYMNSTAFLSHEAVQKATVAHALGVHHLLGDEKNDKLHQYLGGRPLEAKSRLDAAYKIVDRNRRGNREKVAGEFDLLHGMVHAASSPQQTLRAVKSGKSNNVLVNGQSVTLAEGSSEARQSIADNTSNIVRQTESAHADVSGGGVGTPYAPDARTGRIAVRKIGQPEEESVIREFTPAEIKNKASLPKTDDSRGPRVIVDASGLRPGEKLPTKLLKEEKED
jgi:hypothetical protein